MANLHNENMLIKQENSMNVYIDGLVESLRLNC